MRKTHLVICFFIMLGELACQNKMAKNEERRFWSEKGDPEKVGKLLIQDLLNRTGFMMYETEQLTVFHYAEACAAFGAIRLAGAIRDTSLIERLSERYEKVLEDSMPNPANHVDANVYGILPLSLYPYIKDERLLQQGMELADQQWENPLRNGLTNQTRFWIDDVYMIASLQVQAYETTHNRVYLDRAALEVDAYLSKLQQSNGLFFHGDKAPFFWGRGNGWVAAGLTELLAVLPENHPHYPSIVTGYKKMMKSLLDYQSKDGMWRQLIDHETAWKETSATAMFGYSICMGVYRGILPKQPYEESYKKAWNALVNYIDENGQVRNVCAGTGQKNDINYYLDRPVVVGDFHGQAPVLWFAYSLLLSDQKKNLGLHTQTEK